MWMLLIFLLHKLIILKSSWIYNGMRCGWDDVIFMIKVELCWDHEIHIYMSLWWVVARIQGAKMSC